MNFLSVQRQVAVAPDATADAAGPPVPKPPSDINLGFNALDASHRLIEVINQSEIKLSKPGDSGYYKGQVAARHIDFAAVHAVLSGLTANQVKQVEERYLEYEGRPLYVDLFRGGESGHLPDLTVEQQYRLKALLGGTRASSEEDAEAAAQNQREADAAELRGLLTGSLGAAEVERVMTLLRRPADEATALMNEYDLNHDLRSDLFRMGIANAIRAMMLLSGSSLAADAYAIGMARNRIVAIDKALKALSPTKLTVTDVLITLSQVSTPYAAMERRRQIEALTAERKAQVQIIEDRVQVAAGEAKKEAEGEGKDALDIDTAIRTRVSWVLGTEGATEAAIGGTSAKLIGAVATNQPAELMAAQLRKLEEAGKLTTEALADAFRGLRAQAAEEAQRRYPSATVDELKEEERKLSDQWFIHMGSTWDAAVGGEGPTFSQILDRGKQTEVDVKRGLYMASGRLSAVDELVLALAGDRKDMETVKRVLRNKSAAQIEDLKQQYAIRYAFQRSLEYDLFGAAPTRAGEDNPQLAMGGYIKAQGKASGTDRLLLEDYIQRPKQEEGIEEVKYIAGRAEREYEYTIDNRGATGWWRDHWGNEARSLLDATIKEVRAKRAEYLELVKYGADAEAARSEKAHLIIRDMHYARATIRGDRAGYEKATAELRATFQAVASFVLQAVLTAVLTPFATALFAARLAQAGAMAVKFATWTKNMAVGMASTIAANKTVYGNDYTTDMLLRDLKGGLGSAIGATGAERLLGPVTQRLTDRLGKTMAGEVIAGAKTVGGMEVTAVLEGEPANIFENFLEQHFLGKVGEGITRTTTKAIKLGPKAGARGGAIEPYARASGAGTEHEVGLARGMAAESVAVDVDIPEVPTRVSMTLPEPRARMVLEPQPAVKPAAPTTEEPTAKRPAEPPALQESREVSERSAQPPETTGVDITPVPEVHPAPEGEPGHGPDAPVVPGSELDTARGQENRETSQRRRQGHLVEAITLRESTVPDQRARRNTADLMPLHEEWHRLTGSQRQERIAQIVNERLLIGHGIPNLVVEPGTMPFGDAEIRLREMRILISAETLAIERFSQEQFAVLADNIAHEARHALHHFRAIRAALLTGAAPQVENISRRLIEAATVANNGGAEPLARGTPAFEEAMHVYEETYGAGAERRQQALDRERDTAAIRALAQQDLEAARGRGNAQEIADAEREYARATAEARRAHNDYVALSAEIDAWRQGSATRAAIREHFAVQDALLRARVAAEHAENVYLELNNLRVEAETAGHHLSAPMLRRWQLARNKYLATQQKVHALQAQLAAFAQ
ncbi:MAG: hypothetical protein ACRERE_44380 [Candidatus Entotheonellia bacterium]